MILSKANLEVYRVAASERGRYALNGVLVQPDGTTVAADGAYLLAVGPADPIVKDTADVLTGFSANGVHDDVLVPADAMDEARSALPKKKNSECDVQRRAASIDVDEDGVHITTSGERTRTVTADAVEGQFPDYGMILPDPDADPVVSFDARRMYDLCDAMLRAAGGTRSKARELDVSLTVTAADAPFRLRARTDNGQDMVGLLSPTVPDDDNMDAPDKSAPPGAPSTWERYLDAPAAVRHAIADAPTCRDEILELHRLSETADARAEHLEEQWTYVRNIVQGAAVTHTAAEDDDGGPDVADAPDAVHNTVRRFHGAAAPMAG